MLVFGIGCCLIHKVMEGKWGLEAKKVEKHCARESRSPKSAVVLEQEVARCAMVLRSWRNAFCRFWTIPPRKLPPDLHHTEGGSWGERSDSQPGLRKSWGAPPARVKGAPRHEEVREVLLGDKLIDYAAKHRLLPHPHCPAPLQGSKPCHAEACFGNGVPPNS